MTDLKGDGLPGPQGKPDSVIDWGLERRATLSANKLECNACPVLCQISEGRSGACDRYANKEGVLVRLDPVVVLRQSGQAGMSALQDLSPRPNLAGDSEDDLDAPGSSRVRQANETNQGSEAKEGNDDARVFITGVGSSTTYPDYKPAPFIVASQVRGVDMVTVVTEGIFSYCSLKVKIDTDRYLGPEQASVRYQGEIVGHVSTIEYGSQMLSLGGVHHLTGGSKKEGRVTLELMQALGNLEHAQVSIDGGATVVLQAGAPPIVNGVTEQRMRVGCGSAAIGIFAQQWLGLCDEVVVVDDHITGVLSEHQAGKCLSVAPSGIRIKGRKSTPGRYFQVANPGTGWGGTDIEDPLMILDAWDPKFARPGLRLLMTSTTGEHASWYELDHELRPQLRAMPRAVRSVVERISENCEPSLVSVMFLGGAGGSLRAGVTDNPVRLTRAIKQSLVNVTCGGAPCFIWPGGGITLMVDVTRMPRGSFGTVPTPAIVAPIEFTMRLSDYEALGGHMGYVRSLADTLRHGAWHNDGAPTQLRWQRVVANSTDANPWPLDQCAMPIATRQGPSS